jgi:glycyl-tRNA synthetase alpha subunit
MFPLLGHRPSSWITHKENIYEVLYNDPTKNFSPRGATSNQAQRIIVQIVFLKSDINFIRQFFYQTELKPISFISLLMSPLLGHRPSLWITHKENIYEVLYNHQTKNLSSRGGTSYQAQRIISHKFFFKSDIIFIRQFFYQTAIKRRWTYR